jgi:ubiquinone/menaquinone biosynthesis C-methylase UbiE
MRSVARASWRWLLGVFPFRLGERVFQSWVNVLGEQEDERAALRALFTVADHVERELDHAAIRLDAGVHAKHRLTSYHDFFVERIRAGERVLDLGCGKGELAYDIAVRAGAEVVGIDRKRTSLDFASRHFVHARLSFVEGDVLVAALPERIDVVVLSNVIEHLEDRIELLRRVRHELEPRSVLLRVPAENRHWHVPLRRELGLTWFSDPSHVVEYDAERLESELEAAGLRAVEVVSRWGELWADARPLDAR